jgi:hypothetical protein
MDLLQCPSLLASIFVCLFNVQIKEFYVGDLADERADEDAVIPDIPSKSKKGD